ncbi:uncharacterized protein [Solanum lycopersicum]|uniref:uncharacterized protein n=1 Tax=Solanum lycopersicum TaxID=4081 RepID=UPI00374A04AD
MEEGLRRSPRLVTASNPKVYRRNRKKLQVSSSNSTDEIPSFSLGISQISGDKNNEEKNNEEKNNEEENKKQKKGKKRVKEVKTMKKSKKICVTLASTSKKIVDSDDDFEDLPPQFQSKSLKNKDGLEKKRPVNDGKTRNRLPKSVILLESRYPLFSGKITVPKSHLRALFLAKKFIDDDSAVSLAVLYFINDFLFSYEDNEYQISNRDFYLVESGKFNSYPWGLDVYKKLSDSVRHELKSIHKYYRIGGLPLALQIWIFECCSKVDEDIAIRVADSIPRILNWKTIAESPWLKYIEKCLFMPTKNKFENIVASEDEVSKFRLPETRDYHAEILKLEPKGSNHGLDILTNEVIELRKELVKVNENNKALEEKIDLGFNQIKEFVVNSNKQLLEDISLLFAKSGGSSSVIREVKEPSKKHVGETFSGGLDFNGDLFKLEARKLQLQLSPRHCIE